MVHDAEVARYNLVLQHGAGWDVDPVPVVGDDDDGALGGRGDSFPKVLPHRIRTNQD